MIDSGGSRSTGARSHSSSGRRSAPCLGVVLINILPGVAIGVALSFILLIHTIDHPHIASLGRSSDGSRFSDLEDDPGAKPIPAC
jgi:MFS superfamily sulfate permease-like transporter